MNATFLVRMEAVRTNAISNKNLLNLQPSSQVPPINGIKNLPIAAPLP